MVEKSRGDMENGRPQGSDREPPLSHNWSLRQITITFYEYQRDSGWENIKRKRVAKQMAVDLLMQKIHSHFGGLKFKNLQINIFMIFSVYYLNNK